MSKKLFLAAASVAAMAFAGAANAGEISGAFGTRADATAPVVPAATGVYTKTAPYLVAAERIVSADAKIAGTIAATNTFTAPIAIPLGAQRDHLVTFTVTGATVKNPVLTYTAPGAGTIAQSLVSNTDGVVTFLVTVSNGASLASLTLNADVEQSAQGSITVANSVVAVIGATNITVDTAKAVTAAKYTAALASLTAEPTASLVADLPSYKTINGGASAALADTFLAVGDDEVHSNLAGAVVDAYGILDGGTLTVRGPLIDKDVTVALAGTAAATTELNTAVFTLNAAQAADFATNDAGATLVISQPADAAKKKAFNAGTYTVTWAPKAAANFSVPAASTADAGTVTLEGTNFVAPWVSGSGASTSVIRVSNSNSAASGAVTVRLVNGVKVVNGVSTPVASTAVLNAGVVPAGADLQITSAQLVAAFGDFTRGDVQVTINSTGVGFTAKMRNTRDGVTFEQSLGAGL